MKPRRRVFIDPEVQGALARRLSLHWLVYLVVATLLIVGLKWLVDPFTPITEHLADAARSYSAPLLVLFCLTPLFVYDAMKLSNRFSGPMHRLRREMKRLADGEPVNEVELRSGDFWKDFAVDFNRVAEVCQSRASQEPITIAFADRVEEESDELVGAGAD